MKELDVKQPIYKALVNRSEINGEYYKQGQLTLLEGLTQEQVDYGISRGFYTLFGEIEQGAALPESGDEGCHGC